MRDAVLRLSRNEERGTRKLISAFSFLGPFFCFILLAAPADGQQAPRTILAVGAHAGDMELTAGAVLLKQRQLGDRVVILHLSLGERGNPRLAAAAYGAQKRKEAEAAARVLGGDVLFAPYRDGEVPNNDEARRYVADVIRQVKPTLVITHWQRPPECPAIFATVVPKTIFNLVRLARL